MEDGRIQDEYEIVDFDPELVKKGTIVLHNKFGVGEVFGFKDNLVNVEFGSASKCFSWPMSFYNGFLSIIEQKIEEESVPCNLNVTFVLQLVKPYLNTDMEISRAEFVDIFGEMKPAEIGEIHNIINENGIILVEEKKDEAEKIDRILKASSLNGDDGYENMLHLTNEQLCVMAQEGDQRAKSAIIKKNHRFVYGVALRYMKIHSRSTLDIDDMYQNGNLGLLAAIDRFDVSLDYKFLTYAEYWIMQSISRTAIDTGYSIRIPVHMFEKAMRVYRYRKQFPDYDETELFAKMSCDGVVNSREDFKKVNEILNSHLNISSLNQMVGENEDSELLEFIPDEHQPSVESIVAQGMLGKQLVETLKTLTKREEEIIRLRFGLDDGRVRTLEEIGQKYKVTRERIRQIEAKALRKLRHPSRSKRLKDYLG